MSNHFPYTCTQRDHRDPVVIRQVYLHAMDENTGEFFLIVESELCNGTWFTQEMPMPDHEHCAMFATELKLMTLGSRN